MHLSPRAEPPPNTQHPTPPPTQPPTHLPAPPAPSTSGPAASRSGAASTSPPAGRRAAARCRAGSRQSGRPRGCPAAGLQDGDQHGKALQRTTRHGMAWHINVVPCAAGKGAKKVGACMELFPSSKKCLPAPTVCGRGKVLHPLGQQAPGHGAEEGNSHCAVARAAGRSRVSRATACTTAARSGQAQGGLALQGAQRRLASRSV